VLQGLKVGDRVAYSSVFQTYAEYTAVPAAKLLPVPDKVPLDVAVACGVQASNPPFSPLHSCSGD
jgi:NADPH2:quinone reductase